MSAFKELVTIAAKVAADGAVKGKGMLKDVLSSTAAVTAGEVAEKVAKKAGLMRTNMHGEQVLIVPFFKTTEEKMEKAIAEHPERQKVCFHFGTTLREGVDFFDPDGNKVFETRENKKNYPLLTVIAEKGVFSLFQNRFFYPLLAGFLEKGVISTYRFFSGAIFMTFLSYVSRPFVSSSTSDN